MSQVPAIIYTKTDEAPALATYSLLPIVQAFTRHASRIRPEISLSDASQLSNFSRVSESRWRRWEIWPRAEANIIKLPNISASVPVKAAISELQAQGYKIPDYLTKERARRRKIKTRYDKIRGKRRQSRSSRGNPTAAPKAVKEYARNHPHSMGAWSRIPRPPSMQ
jgi:isocitrate dehydrogenase